MLLERKRERAHRSNRHSLSGKGEGIDPKGAKKSTRGKSSKFGSRVKGGRWADRNRSNEGKEQTHIGVRRRETEREREREREMKGCGGMQNEKRARSNPNPNQNKVNTFGYANPE